ncbi:coenzyme F420 hydrogenase/dehydrogenase beta subunit domain protein [Brachyspira intermedia PWS/A]|uniref:Coenzyme F420 hydrogenase/dehydrogenase beta subunit domain protein n=2 Tax=Brachyspira intermedia TaxID=84377 RepID=G0EQH4_BRAIP|nr:coenzyme F420 hydrogenase/dehydrogenase beta subunit domain protein [Brachyspira intermedia PWS/A]
MIETKEGFHYPLIDDEKCTDCGVCVKRCHSLNDNFKTKHRKEFYEVKASDEIRMKSSSGGMFSLVANYILDRGGYVCGASFSEDWLRVEHIIIDNKKDLDKLRYSKYIESDLGDVFIEVKKLLNDKKEVLFTGAPCQVSALNHYLGRDYDNLLTIDLLCNSVVPQKIWEKYIKEKVENIADIEYVSFRDKNIFKWTTGLYIKTNNKEYLSFGINDLYYKMFVNHTSCKEECLHCKYRRFDRPGDITIGDYWSVKAKYKDDKGISLIKISSNKASKIFNKIKSNCEYKEVNITHDGFEPWITPIWTNRKYFFDNLDKESIEELYKHCSDTKYNVGIVNMINTNNTGGVLTYYALYKLIEQLGYNPILIFNYQATRNLYDNTLGCKAILRYLNVGNSVYNESELYKYNKYCDTFIVGSDVVFALPSWVNLYHHLMNFVPSYKKKISFSSSFSCLPQDYNIGIKRKSLMKYYFEQFDKISVREDDGVEICKNIFNVKADHVLDPVFLLDNYDELLNNKTSTIEGNYLFVYYRNLDNTMQDLINYIEEKLDINVIKLPVTGDWKPTPLYELEDWLYIIKNCKYLITDSYHGFCFGLYFNKNILIKIDSGSSRLLSLMRMFNLEDRIVSSVEDIKNRDLLKDMDYTEINKKLEAEKKRSIEWLKEALESPKVLKEDSYKDDLINILIKDSMNMGASISNLQNNNIDISKSKVIIDLNNKINKLINTIAWWIPIKKWRDDFRNKMLNTDQTRPDQTRPDQT